MRCNITLNIDKYAIKTTKYAKKGNLLVNNVLSPTNYYR